jgi:hypothetical protein
LWIAAALLSAVAPAILQASDVDGASAAFARYVTAPEATNIWSSEEVEIEAVLPKQAKRARLRAIRHATSSGRSDYQVLETAGDPAVRRQVIARYLSAEQDAEAVPAGKVAITPANYEFHYKGTANNGTAYIFQIKPRKKREGLIRGELWLDAETGAAVRLSGYLVRNSSIFLKRVTVTREVTLRNGVAIGRLTHLSVDTRIAGLAELTIKEAPYRATDMGEADTGAAEMSVTCRPAVGTGAASHPHACSNSMISIDGTPRTPLAAKLP